MLEHRSNFPRTLSIIVYIMYFHRHLLSPMPTPLRLRNFIRILITAGSELFLFSDLCCQLSAFLSLDNIDPFHLKLEIVLPTLRISDCWVLLLAICFSRVSRLTTQLSPSSLSPPVISPPYFALRVFLLHSPQHMSRKAEVVQAAAPWKWHYI
jgi:hypothetical protein